MPTKPRAAVKKPVEPIEEVESIEADLLAASEVELDYEEYGPDEPPSDGAVLTINGKPIPLDFLHAIPYAMTDQGIAEKANNGKPRAYTTVVADAWDKQIQKRGAATEPWETGGDPLLEAVDSVREPGMGYRFLSDRVMNRRGKRGYEIVKAENGEPIKVANMLLGKMPLPMQEKRAKFYENKGNEDLRDAQENLRIEQEKVTRDVRGMGELRSGEHLSSEGRSIEVGINRSRGRSNE